MQLPNNFAIDGRPDNHTPYVSLAAHSFRSWCLARTPEDGTSCKSCWHKNCNGNLSFCKKIPTHLNVEETESAREKERRKVNMESRIAEAAPNCGGRVWHFCVVEERNESLRKTFFSRSIHG